MYRPTMQEIYMRMAYTLATRSTCTERSVGCVITSPDFEQVYSVGYNGNAAGLKNICETNDVTQHQCCHAEINALIKCNVKDKNKIAFITLSPCTMCAKYMINSGFSTVYYGEDWKDNPGIQLLARAGIKCIHVKIYPDYDDYIGTHTATFEEV